MDVEIKLSVYYTEYEPFHPELIKIYDNVFNFVNDATVGPYRNEVVAIVTTTSSIYVDEKMMKSFPSLKLICTSSVGYDHIDVKAAKRLGLPVGFVPFVQNEVVADHALALLLASARRVVEADKIVRSPDTKEMYPFHHFMALSVSGTNMGIIGMGRIGMEVAKRAAGFGMKILYHNRNQKSKEDELSVGAQYEPALISLLQKSDFIVLLAPGYKENYHMIGRKQFSEMKNTSVFINMSRGVLVDQDAMVDALKSNRIAHAGLDATDPEPLPRDHPLLSLSNVTLTPHCAGAVMAVRQKQCYITIENILAGVQGKPLVHLVEIS
ncbi:probable 2-ketogluconate reductase [Dysidea avara]|uniref:probable 2-ketogluconate reductase n=1 Tax=Dysidea avara TaxID=196820 RepID=UPI0033286524